MMSTTESRRDVAVGAEQMPRLRATAIACAALLGACLDSSGPRPLPIPDVLPGLVVSAPLLGAAGSARSFLPRSPTSRGGASVVYVSLTPGAVPTGVLATIRNQATGLTVTTAVVNGGFDPIALDASVGDTLVVKVDRASPATAIEVVLPVRANRPPVVVRTEPPPRKRDVPLNAVIVVVFSIPIDQATLTTESVQLWQGATPVPGTVRFADAAHIRAEFVPAALLDGLTEYRLLVSQAIRDVNGMALDTLVDVSFTTGNAAPATGLDFASVIAGGAHTCGLTTTGTAYCWGNNSNGQLGTGTTASSFTPVPVAGDLTFTSVSAGALHSCGVATDGAAYCWGYTPPLGADSATLSTCVSGGQCLSPVPVAAGLRFSSISAGYWHTCGVTTQGAAYCWGFGDAGRLGADSATTSTWNCEHHAYGWVCLTPVPVSGGLVFASVGAGSSLTCGVTATDALYCWGSNGGGQLGISTADGPERCPDGEGGVFSCSTVPVAVAGGLSFTDVTALNTSACGLATSGAAYCWGDSWGATPVAVAGSHSFTALARGGNQHTCAVSATGAAYCWGGGSNGVLGNGTVVDFSATPVPVSGGLSFQAISASEVSSTHTCGMTVDGIAYCWGTNYVGQLGTGTTADSYVPVKVAGQRQ